MKTVSDLIQGTPEWHAFRATHFGASEAAAMLGLSKYTTRSELLHQKVTGFSKEHSGATQAIFARGHETEALARPLVEAVIGEQLSPVTCSEGKLSCSCDGITFDDSVAWEHKQWNVLLANAVALEELPEEHQPQCQQVLMITGAGKLIFTVSDGTLENMVSMEVLPDTAWFERIRAGWAQFEKDLADYVPNEVVAAPVADIIMRLPAVVINATGGLSASNLKEITPRFDTFLAAANTTLKTDEDFVNGDATAKFSRTTADALKMKAKEVIGQISSVSEAVNTLTLYAEKFDALGLKLEKLVKSEKDNRKTQIVCTAEINFSAHIESLESETRPIQLCIKRPDFAEAIKGMKRLDKMQEAVDNALRNSKYEADLVAKDVRAKLKWFTDNVSEDRALMNFRDLKEIIRKPMDDFQLLVCTRQEQVAKAEAEKMESERARIQAEEEAKARVMIEAARMQKIETHNNQPQSKASMLDGVQPEPAAPVTRPDNVVVIEHQDEISAFLASRDFGKEAGKVRAILVEFVKHQESRKMKVAV